MGKFKIFMLMPFNEEHYSLREKLNEILHDENCEVNDVGTDSEQRSIITDIVQKIYDANLIIADLTDMNPNVFYELGVAHALNKDVIMIV